MQLYGKTHHMGNVRVDCAWLILSVAIALRKAWAITLAEKFALIAAVFFTVGVALTSAS